MPSGIILVSGICFLLLFIGGYQWIVIYQPTFHEPRKKEASRSWCGLKYIFRYEVRHK
jgi:hypothetical protein